MIRASWPMALSMCRRARRGGAVGGTELVGEHVVVEEVDVDGGDTAVEVRRDTEGEELPHPDGKHDLEAEPAESIRARAVRMSDHPHDEPRELHRGQPETLRDHPAEQHHGEAQPEQGQAGPGRLHEPGERQEAVLGPAGEDTAIARAALEEFPPACGDTRLHEIGRPRVREMELAAGALVIVVEARDIRLDPVHGGGLKGRSRRGQPDGHRKAEESAARHESRGIGNAPAFSAPSNTSRESPSIWTTRNRRRAFSSVGPSRAHRAIRSTSPWRARTRSSSMSRRSYISRSRYQARVSPGREIHMTSGSSSRRETSAAMRRGGSS